MFEDYVLYLLRKYLGEYVHGLSTEALRISVWKGNVVLKDLKLKAEALNSLKLPVTVHAGFIGSITLKVPWKSLGKEPVVVFIDRIFILAHPAPDGQSLKEEDREKLFEAKLQQIEEAELATLEAAARKSKVGSSPSGSSWLGSLIATIIGNLKISITNVHIRYEDTVSNPGHPFCSGLTLSKLAAVTMDEEGNETFDTSGALDKLRKSLQLQRLAVYHDSDSPPWKLGKRWEDLNPVEWTEIFADGIGEILHHEAVSIWAMKRKYLVSPINGILKYHRVGKQERHDPVVPLEKASLVLSDVSFTISEAQYYDGIKLLETFSRYKTRIEISHLRPMLPVFDDPHVWWRYVAQASLQQKKMCYRFSWERIKHLCQLRRKYVQVYASFLQQLTVDISEIRQIEKALDSKVILLWRLLAHAKVESVKSKEASQQKSSLKGRWWSFPWLTSSGDASITNNSVGEKLVEDERLSKEEWESLNKLLSYHLDEDAVSVSAKDMQTMVQFLVDVSIGQAAARIVSINQTEVLCGRFEQLQVTTKLYHKSVHCDLSLKFYGLCAPEGSLAQSVSNERKANALAATFVYSPAWENVDWRLSATIAPCHVTVLMESYERFLEFIKRSNAVSPAVALETVTALQMKIEKVTRRAQEQFQMVLEEKSRFALDIDFDAPKVRVPMKVTGSTCGSEDFLLDFGHFTLRTRESERQEQRQSLYSRFYISVRDIAAFFMDASSSATGSVNEQPSPSAEDLKQFYSLIDRCGMSVIVDLIKIPHPRYPSMRVSVQVPSLCIHFSAARYCRIIDLLNMFYGSRGTNDLITDGYMESNLVPWYPADLATIARILVWRGIGNTLAEWKPCFILLSGLYLYVLESEVSQKYQRCTSMAGRQVFEVSPSSVGGSLFSIAVSCRGIDIQKALESSSTLILEFRDDDEKAIWLKELVQATYRASAPPDIDIFGGTVLSESKSCGDPTYDQGKTDLVINGALFETTLSIYGKSENTGEEIILELLAAGGKVNLVRSEADLIVKMKLHSLKVKDELQSRLAPSPQYLACSVLMDDMDSSSPSCHHRSKRVFHNFLFEEDDIFKDALPHFLSTSDQTLSAQLLDPSPRPCDFQASEAYGVMASNESSSHEKDGTKGKIAPEVFYEAEDNGTSDFIAVNFLTRNPDSPLYDGMDTQMTICMSKLDFFCNRPTLLALIAFGLELSSVNSGVTNADDTNVSQAATLQGREKADESRSNVIKGLLGLGKDRVVFNLSMDVDSVCIFLNKEDGSRLAMFVQESFLLDIKVHPNSLSIDGTLGNLRLCDLSLGPDHCWGWLCDLRNQGTESFIKFTFKSYSAADDDYDGYDYSLHGRLSAVRIVFLYRFVQEITSYFMELATPHTDEVIRFVDKVGDLEWLIQKYEIDGASAIKLDLSLDTPTIIVPRHSLSKDFLQLDLGHLYLSNSFSWHGCQDTDPSAVHLDVLDVEVHGINMAVGINGFLGKPMIREGQGLNVHVRRSLRDVFRKVPMAYVEVRVGLLHCVLTDKEYNVIRDCAYMNISEEPKLPPSFRLVTNDSMRILADKVQHNSQIFLSHRVAVVALEIQSALLDLHNGLDGESPLAHIALEGLWLSYRTTSLLESDLYITISKLSILDIRPDTKPEMRLMLGSSSDASRHSISSSRSSAPTWAQSSNDDSTKCTGPGAESDLPNLTLLIMDYRLRPSSQSLVIRIQQPRILVVLDFLLPVVEFFVPALGVVTGREVMMHAQNDPLTKCDDIVLSEPIYMQENEVVYLSPRRRLIVDGFSVDEFIYDGGGGTIHLADDSEFKNKSSGTQPMIILIGRGKKLRFKNVKFENGALLRNCTYLGNDSSYSVSADDGVEISLLQSFATDKAAGNWNESQECDQVLPVNTTSSPTESNQINSASVEIQVVSSEFIFYDSTKLSMDDSFLVEKLLRLKMDLCFMYASRENDTWVRALLKDLTVEAGSGLVVLDPLNISGGYTSVKDKTNISIMSTDIYMHLSLSVASLLLQLQNQATEALQFGNANPLATCTNFKQVWVSQRGEVSGYNLTFWRPQAPSNFVILGDCVTSRPIPPSQVVMAVSNTYGRVRKPVGFKLICSVSDLQRLEDGECKSDIDNECLLWMPVAPPGYSVLGCVAHIGNQPPPNHIVYCIRSDLISSTTILDCVFSISPSPRLLSGFSIWRVDNSVGSFCAHSSVGRPPKMNCFDLHQILLNNSYLHIPFISIYNDSIDHGHTSKPGSNSNSSSSGWDIVRSLSKSNGLSISTPHFERMWWDKGCEFCRPVSIWRPLPRPGFSALGDCIVEGLEPPALGLLFKSDNSGISARPVQFTKVANIIRKGLDEVFVWYPIAPPGYASLGCIVTRTDEVPTNDSFCCARMDLVNQANISDMPISRSSSSKGSNCWSIWKVENQACTFLARSDVKKPSCRLAYNISDHLKPRTRENISVEMKLGCLSLTALDSLYGMLTPVLDTTITNINLATHGRLDSMSAVLICSIAASTFNKQLEAWEPLVEPFDGIFKVETYDMNEQPPTRIGKRLRVSTTTTVNLNLSAANLETMTDFIISWRKQRDLEQKSTKKNEECDVNLSSIDGSIFSALDEEDLQKVIIENKLGCGIYLRKLEQSSETVELLQHGKQASVIVPPPQFSNQLNTADESRETRCYVAIKIFESTGLPIQDDGNAHDFFCALRLVVDSNVSDQEKLFPQSARTRCVRPLISRGNAIEGIVKWNEVFIFEIPDKGLANLEVEVTNLASRAGKGEIIGASSIPIGNSVNRLKRVASIKMLQHSADIQKPFSYPLINRGQHANGSRRDCGRLLVSTAFFERNTIAKIQRDIEGTVMNDKDVSFWVGLGPDGPWESFGSLLPVAVVPKSINENLFAFEVVMRNGKKHAILRPLAVVINETDVKMEVSTCPSSVLHNSVPGMKNSATKAIEEIFQNQHYQPSSGWGHKFEGSSNNGVGHWSTQDFSLSSKEFFEPPLPTGWRWTSAWTIEKSPFTDGDGWAYGPHFQSIKWPPDSSKSSSKSSLDCVRRRRWIRERERMENTEDMRKVFAQLSPGSSAILPWSSMQLDLDLCLQIRPYAEYPAAEYCWGQIITLASGSSSRSDQAMTEQSPFSRQSSTRYKNFSLPCPDLKLGRLEKKDMIMSCHTSNNNRQHFWLSVGTDASVLHTDLNIPVYDWKISINAPLKLENKLPYNAEFAIWEKTVEGNRVERHHGIISACSSEFLYSVDLRRPLYLTLFLQGGWVMEKDAILIVDMSAHVYASSFFIVHQQTKRRLRVSIECDMGGTDAAPKTVRLFVPYWISNDTSIPLSYRVVEVEPMDNVESDLISVSGVVKSTKSALEHTSRRIDTKVPTPQRNIQTLEVIEDLGQTCVMLSPQAYIGRSAILPFSSRNDAFLSPRVGVAVAVRGSECYSPGISLTDLENKERVDVRAFTTNGAYYKLSVLLNMASDRTKVVHFQHQVLFINRVGQSFSLKQCNSEFEEWVHPYDPPKMFKWQSSTKTELLKLRLDGYKWSTPFSVENEGIMCIALKNNIGSEQKYLRVEVRSGVKSSRFEVVFRLGSFSSPYRIENRSMFLPLRIRQVDGTEDSWRSLPPNSAISFYWEDLGRQRLLEVLVDGSDPVKSEKYNIDQVMDHKPLLMSSGPIRPMRLIVIKEGKNFVCKISDWMPDDEAMTITHRSSLALTCSSESDYGQETYSTDGELHVALELAEVGLSIIDHMPEEILYLSIQNLLLSYSTGLGSGISRFKLRMRSIQMDNQLPFTPMPVLLRPQRVEDHLDYILKFSVTMQASGSFDLCVYPYLGFQGPENSAFLVNIHEPIIWRLHEMFQQAKVSRIYGSQTADVSVDPIIQIGLLNISEIRFRVSMAMSPAQRPRGVLGFWSSLMTALGNTEHMPVRINQRFHEDICMRQSALVAAAKSNIQKDLLSQPLQLLSGVDILGNASSALGHMSKGMAALSMDKKFIQSRQKQESKGVEDIGDVIREGGGAFAKGLFRGVTGILTKPLEGAKSSGVEGFVQGVGKGIIGAAAQPVSGVLDLLSKTTEGANAVKMKLASALTSEEQLLRRRLSRAIGGDNLLRPYDEYKAMGQVILQLAESGAFLGQVDLFKVRGKFALSDAYEDHFLLPKGKILVVTHRRVLLLQQPINIGAQKKFNPARDACSVLWDVLWDDLVTMELAHGKNEQPKSPLLILYLKIRSFESKESTRVIECCRGSQQAIEVYSSIEKAMSTYGPKHSKDMQRRKVNKPYTPHRTAASTPVFPKGGLGNWPVLEMPATVPVSSSFGSASSTTP